MRYRVEKSVVRIIGLGWYGNTCAMCKELSGYDVGNLEDSGLREGLSKEETRNVIEGWLAMNTGDFQEILDFEADIELGDGGNVLLEWTKEDSESEYFEAVYTEVYEMWGYYG